MSENMSVVPQGSSALPEQIEKVLLEGDLSKLTAEQRVHYYNAVCKSIGLNPLTRPFDYIWLKKKVKDQDVWTLQFYAKKDTTEQLRKIYGVSVLKIDEKVIDGLYIVDCYVKDSAGRVDVDKGVVDIKNLYGDRKANAIMKAMTKAKRRATLSISGLGWLDESEIETIAKSDVQMAEVTSTGEVVTELPKVEANVSPSVTGVLDPIPEERKESSGEFRYRFAKSHPEFPKLLTIARNHKKASGGRWDQETGDWVFSTPSKSLSQFLVNGEPQKPLHPDLETPPVEQDSPTWMSEPEEESGMNL